MLQSKAAVPIERTPRLLVIFFPYGTITVTTGSGAVGVLVGIARVLVGQGVREGSDRSGVPVKVISRPGLGVLTGGRVYVAVLNVGCVVGVLGRVSATVTEGEDVGA